MEIERYASLAQGASRIFDLAAEVNLLQEAGFLGEPLRRQEFILVAIDVIVVAIVAIVAKRRSGLKYGSGGQQRTVNLRPEGQENQE